MFFKQEYDGAIADFTEEMKLDPDNKKLFKGRAAARFKKGDYDGTITDVTEYLRHDKGAVRNLAAWHLVRLVPEGKAIPYSPGGTRAEQEAAYQAWKKLIPAGTVPGGGKKP